ncbi:MAG: hypothetical protein ACTSPY_10745 [Candidatus Helarchaeota archaeon]
MTIKNKNQKNLRKGLANLFLISLLYIGLPIAFIILAPLLIPTFQVDISLIVGIIIIGISNAVSFFLRGYYPPKSLPNIIGGLALCVFSGLFFMYWLVIGSGFEISTNLYTAQANLGIISQIFVWTLIGTSAAFILELFHYYKKIRNYKIVKMTKYGFLIANIITIGLLGVLIYQMAMTRYGVVSVNVNTQIVGSQKYYAIETYIDLSNSGFIPINNIMVEISVYVEESPYFQQGYFLGRNILSLSNVNGGAEYFGLCNATTTLINNTLTINSLLVEVIFYGSCFGASMEILYVALENV